MKKAERHKEWFQQLFQCPHSIIRNHPFHLRQELGSIDLNAGDQLLKVELSAGSVNIDYFTLVSVDTNFEFYAVYANDIPLVGKRTIPRGTDNFNIYFTIGLDETSINNSNIKLMCGNEEIPCVLTVDKNVISVR